MKTTMTWNRDGPSDAMEFDSRNSSSLSMRQQYNIARSIIAKNQNVSRKSIEIKFRDVLKRLRDERDLKLVETSIVDSEKAKTDGI